MPHASYLLGDGFFELNFLEKKEARHWTVEGGCLSTDIDETFSNDTCFGVMSTVV